MSITASVEFEALPFANHFIKPERHLKLVEPERPAPSLSVPLEEMLDRILPPDAKPYSEPPSPYTDEELSQRLKSWHEGSYRTDQIMELMQLGKCGILGVAFHDMQRVAALGIQTTVTKNHLGKLYENFGYQRALHDTVRTLEAQSKAAGFASLVARTAASVDQTLPPEVWLG